MTRCSFPDCKKKVTLEIDCRCGKQHCPQHRMPETHKCTYDFKTEALKTLSESLVKVVAEKLLTV